MLIVGWRVGCAVLLRWGVAHCLRPHRRFLHGPVVDSRGDRSDPRNAVRRIAPFGRAAQADPDFPGYRCHRAAGCGRRIGKVAGPWPRRSGWPGSKALGAFGVAVVFARYLTEPVFRLIARAGTTEVYTANRAVHRAGGRLGDGNGWPVADIGGVPRRDGGGGFALSHPRADRDRCISGPFSQCFFFILGAGLSHFLWGRRTAGLINYLPSYLSARSDCRSIPAALGAGLAVGAAGRGWF